jgi:WD40 repeat protein
MRGTSWAVLCWLALTVGVLFDLAAGQIDITTFSEKPAMELFGAHESSVNRFSFTSAANANSFLYGISSSADNNSALVIWGGPARIGAWNNDGSKATNIIRLTGHIARSNIPRFHLSPIGNALASGADDRRMLIWGHATSNDISQWATTPQYIYTSGVTANFCDNPSAIPLPRWSNGGNKLLVACVLPPSTAAGTGAAQAIGITGAGTNPTSPAFNPTATTPVKIALGTSGGTYKAQGAVAFYPGTGDTWALVAVYDSQSATTLNTRSRIDVIGTPLFGTASAVSMAMCAAGVESFYSGCATTSSKGKGKSKTRAMPTTADLTVTTLTYSPNVIGGGNNNYWLVFQQNFRCYTQVRSIPATQPTATDFSNVGTAVFTWNLDSLTKANGVAWGGGTNGQTYLAVACGDAYLRVFSSVTWASLPIRTFNTYAGVVFFAAFSPNGEYLAAAVAPATIKIYGGCQTGTQVSALNTTSAVCSSCLAGKANPTPGGLCTDCPNGYAQPFSGQTSCLPCGRGNVSTLTTGSTSCSRCGVGRFGSAIVNLACADCDPGTYQPSTGQSRCLFCGSGTYTNASLATGCLSCTPGFSLSDVGGTSCVACSAGRYSTIFGAGDCTSCSPGRTTPGGPFASGQTSCILCAVGKSSNAGDPQCSDCAVGFFAPTEGSVSCTSCPAGLFNNQTGLTSCSPCAPSTRGDYGKPNQW